MWSDSGLRFSDIKSIDIYSLTDLPKLKKFKQKRLSLPLYRHRPSFSVVGKKHGLTSMLINVWGRASA